MDIQTQIKELERKVEELNQKFNSLQSDTTIPLPIDRAFTKRLRVAKTDVSSESISTHIQSKSINEAGSSSYSITFAKPMDGFITIEVNGTQKKIPYYV